jgi:anti-sigma B factor antagonist
MIFTHLGVSHPALKLRFPVSTGDSLKVYVHTNRDSRPDVAQINSRESVGRSGMKIVASEGGALASVFGRIDLDSSPALRERLLALLQSPHPKVVSIDLSGVNHIDSSGVATLIEALKIARDDGTDLRLQGLHDRLLHLFESTGILALFNGSVGTTRRCGSEAV